MPLPVFPTSLIACAEISGGLDDPYLEETFESGADAARPLYTSPRESPWALRWPLMSDTEYDALMTFYLANRGTTFLWTDHTGVAHEVRFTGSPTRWSKSWRAKGYRDITVTIRKVRDADA